MYEKYKVPIAVVGMGGSGSEQWMPDVRFDKFIDKDRGSLYNWMMTRIRELGVGGFRAVLWHQGESDSDENPDVYYNRLKTIIISSNEDALWKFPWFVVNASFLRGRGSIFEPTRKARQRLWTDRIALRGPDTDILQAGDRDEFSSHLTPDGLVKHGNMWAECVGNYLDKIL